MHGCPYVPGKKGSLGLRLHIVVAVIERDG